MKHYCVLGPGKAGSTWLYNVFLQSDAVAEPAIKESYFFQKAHDDASAYERLFTAAPGAQWFGDVSNQYYKSLGCIDNARRLYPDTLFIYLIRDPVERLLSAWRFERKQGRALDLQTYIGELNIAQFDDSSILNEVRRKVPRGQLLVLRFDDIAERPDHVLQTLSTVMGIPFEALPDERAKNVSVQPRSRLAARAGRAVAHQLRRAGLLGLLQRLKSSAVVTRMFYSDRPIDVSAADRALARRTIPESYHCDFPTGLADPHTP